MAQMKLVGRLGENPILTWGQTGMMKTALKSMVVLGVGLLILQIGSGESTAFMTPRDEMSYAIGVDIARNFKSQGVELVLDDLVTGMKDAFSGQKLLMTEVDFREAMNAYQKELKEGEAKKIPAHVSYAVGVDAARNLKRMGVELSIDFLVQALRDVFLGQKLLMNNNDLRLNLNLFQLAVRQKRNQDRAMLAKNAENNRKEGEAFLAGNKTKEGVVTLPSGLQYKILKEGDGKKPAEADTVEANYRGTLIDGTEFESSEAGKSATFKVATVIPGWKEALKIMSVGSKWQLFIPPELAYGQRGDGRAIGPNATLIFEIELLAIK